MPPKPTCDCGTCWVCKHRRCAKQWKDAHPDYMRSYRAKQRGDPSAVTQHKPTLDESALKWLQDRGFR